MRKHMKRNEQLNKTRHLYKFCFRTTPCIVGCTPTIQLIAQSRSCAACARSMLARKQDQLSKAVLVSEHCVFQILPLRHQKPKETKTMEDGSKLTSNAL